jgi:D-ribose pyranose/furanose isomerase RbsD
MTNVFKVKSRFASLVEEEEIEEKNKNNKEKINKNESLEKNERLTSNTKYDNKKRQEYSSSSNNTNNNNNNNNKFIDEKGKKVKEEQKKIVINDCNFPVLSNEKISEKINENVSEKLNFIDKVKTEMKVEEEILNEEYIPPGYLVIKRDKNTNKIIRKYGEMPDYFNKKEITPSEIIDKLVYLYEKRKEEYITLWGEEEYEKMFLFNNYDYHYFDKLDLQYEEELKKINYDEEKLFNDNNGYYNDHYYNNKYDD